MQIKGKPAITEEPNNHKTPNKPAIKLLPKSSPEEQPNVPHQVNPANINNNKPPAKVNGKKKPK